MIDLKSIYKQLEMEEVNFNGDIRYKGRDSKYYRWVVNRQDVVLYESRSVNDGMNRVLSVFRIYPSDDMREIMYLILESYMKDPAAYLKSYRDQSRQIKFVWATLGRKLGARELENLCVLFYDAVRVGEPAQDLSEAIKEVLKIHSMPPSEFSHPELHELLLKVPDTYYDFISSTERNTQRNPGLQERYIRHLMKYPETTSTDLIIFGSMLNADFTYKDEWIRRVIDLVNQDETFAIYGVRHGENEVLQYDNKHDWHIFVKYLKKYSYTFRQVKSLVFVDYMDRCYRAAMVCKVGDDLAMIYDVAETLFSKPEIYEALIEYLEKLVVAAGFHNVLSFVKPENIELYESLGFELSEDEIIDNPYVDEEERVFMWKKLIY